MQDPDPFNLRRFVEAQDRVIADVLRELRDGRKRTHWMWFVFPQIDGLGLSATARHYAITSLEEARSYLAHEVLGPRLIECTTLVNAIDGRWLRDILGTPDDLKFRSSMTLFARADPAAAPFREALDRHCGGRDDEATLRRLAS